MKKFVIIGIAFLGVLLVSCDDIEQNDITDFEWKSDIQKEFEGTFNGVLEIGDKIEFTVIQDQAPGIVVVKIDCLNWTSMWEATGWGKGSDGNTYVIYATKSWTGSKFITTYRAVKTEGVPLDC